MPQSQGFYPTSQLMEVAFGAVLEAHAFLSDTISYDPKFNFEKIRMRPDAPDEKDALMIDRMAEEACRTFFRDRLGSFVHVVGEESAGRMKPESKVCALVDIVDGTDLLAMQIPLWCSAIVLYEREAPHKILGSVVGLATGEIYMASESEPRATVATPPHDVKTVHLTHFVSGPSSTRALRSARIAHYGQKAKNFLSVVNTPAFIKAAEGMTRRDSFRIYNFAGNPIMMKLADRLKDDESQQVIADGIDAVFDVSGQLLHDVVPGVFIAMKAGAFLCDLEGKEIGYEALGMMLAKRDARLKYVLAATPELALELCAALKTEPSPALPF